MASIFLSYAREDLACAEALARVLEAAGHKVWWDRHLNSGSEFAAEIEAALEAADAVLVAWSKASIKSRWVRDEASVGGDTGRLVPVAIDGTLPPMGFRQFHTMDLSGWKGASKDKRTAALLQAIEGRLKGLEDEGPASRPAQRKRFALPRGKALWAIAAALVLAIVAATSVFILNRERPLLGPPPKPTVALLPFTQASPDPELSELAAKARASIAHTLSQSGMPVRQLSSAPQAGQPAGDFLISGEVSKDLDKLVATVRLDEAAHGVTVFSRRFEVGHEDAGDLPERIGVQIAGTLTWAGVLMMLDRRHSPDPTLTAELLKQANLTSDPLEDYQNAQRAAAMAPDSGIAQLSLAFATAFILDMIPREERSEALAKARLAADRAIALAPEFGDVYGPGCFLQSETRLADCEDRLRAGKRVDPDAPFLNHFLSQVMRRVGRLDDSFELARLSYVHDPYVPRKIGMMLRMLETKGDTEEASRLHQQGDRWWPEFRPLFFYERAIGMILRGNLEGLGRLEKEAGANLPEGHRRSSDLVAAMKSKSLPALRQACANPKDRELACLTAFAALGDQNSAFALADKLYPTRIGRTPAETERIWIDRPFGAGLLDLLVSPAAAPLRRDPRYLQLAQRVGLLAYWRSGRPPDFCRNDPEPICRQLLKRS